MKKLITFLMPFLLLTFAFAQENGYYTHQSKVFKIIPPRDYNKTILSEDGVQFINPQEKSWLLITFTNLKHKISDKELIERFLDDKFRNNFIKEFENSASSFQTKVTDSRQRNVNGIPAWEFITAGLAKDDSINNKIIVFYKNNKEFFIMFNGNLNVFGAVEQSLATFEVLS